MGRKIIQKLYNFAFDTWYHILTSLHYYAVAYREKLRKLKEKIYKSAYRLPPPSSKISNNIKLFFIQCVDNLSLASLVWMKIKCNKNSKYLLFVCIMFVHSKMRTGIIKILTFRIFLVLAVWYYLKVHSKMCKIFKAYFKMMLQ